MAGVPFVGLTGGLGAGKSEALRALGELGAATLSTDAVVHELLATDELRDIVVARLGDGVRRDGALDRSLIAERVFGDDEARGWLEGELWPRVGQRVAEWKQEVDVLDPPPPRRGGRGAAPVRVGHGAGVRRDDRRDRRRGRPRRARGRTRPRIGGGARRPPAVAGGKGAESGLHGAQRR